MKRTRYYCSSAARVRRARASGGEGEGVRGRGRRALGGGAAGPRPPAPPENKDLLLAQTGQSRGLALARAHGSSFSLVLF